MSRLLSNINLTPFFHPDGPGTMSPMGKEDIINFLNQDDNPDDPPIPLEDKEEKEEKEPKKPKATKEPEPEEDDDDDDETPDGDADEKNEEDDLDEFDEDNNPNEEELELVTPVRRKEILSKYPKLFKDFPYLEKAYYREQQFTEVFPTIDDAKRAQNDSETLSTMEDDFRNGNTELMLTAIKQSDAKGFAKLVDNLLPTLQKVDNDAYLHTVGNIVKHTIIAMVRRARSSGNDSLQNAAAIVNQFVFGTEDFEHPTTLGSKVKGADESEESKKLKEEREEFNRSRFETARTETNTRINNSIKATIEANIDPKESMTAFIKRTASRDALEQVEDLLNKDTRLKQIVDKLWLKASESKFSKDSVDKIRQAYLTRAKTLLPTVIKKARNEALRGMGKRVREDEDTDTRVKSRSKDKDEPQSKRSGKITNARDIPKRMTTLEFLNSED